MQTAVDEAGETEADVEGPFVAYAGEAGEVTKAGGKGV